MPKREELSPYCKHYPLLWLDPLLEALHIHICYIGKKNGHFSIRVNDLLSKKKKKKSHNLAFNRAVTTRPIYNGADRATATTLMHHGANRTISTTPTLSSPKVPFNSLSLLLSRSYKIKFLSNNYSIWSSNNISTYYV